MRLDKRVAEQFGLSRRAAQHAVRRGQVDVTGRPCLEPGCEVEHDASLAYCPGRPRAEIAARRLRVLYEDRHILVVDKPAKVLTQPTPDRERDTLLERAGRYLSRTRGVARPYIGIVHRIDQNTSGVVLLVCSPKALRPFQAMFRAHTIDRSYLAVVQGIVKPPRGTIDLPIEMDRRHNRRGVSPTSARGAAAVTHYELVEQFGRVAAQLDCRLETGRTHQIRIHLAEAGYPVVGDPVYRSASSPRFPISFPRQALHAQSLGFVHPMTCEAVRITAPAPADLAELIVALRHRFGRLQ